MKINKIILFVLFFLPLQLFAATATLTPATKDYGNVTIGSSSTQVFTLTPAGAGAVGVTSVTVSAAPFTKVLDGCTGISITAPATCTVTVQFSPTAVTTSIGTLTFVVTGTTDGTTKISSLAGTGTTGPSVTASISPTTFAYGNVTIGNTSAAIFTITNTGGTSNLTITSATVAAAPFTKTVDNCTGASLPLLGTCTIEVTYIPTAAVLSNSLLTVVTNATDGTSKIASLSGTGVTGTTVTATLTPTSYSYGNVTIGSTSAATFTITNTGGNTNLTIASATIAAAPFTKTADNCTGASLSLLGTCTIEVTYIPTAVVLSNSLLTVVTNATNGTTKISSLSGVGVTGPTVTGSMTPASNNYGNVTIGSASTATFTVTNTGGSVNLAITSATVSAAPFTKTADNCTGASLPLAGTCTIEVTYFPTVAAISFATLTVVTNATDGTSKISSLIGTGVTGPTVTGSMTPASNNYGNVTIGSASTATFTVTNTGGSVNLAITSATVSAAPFTKTADNCTGASLPLAGTCTIEVTFFPTTAAISFATLTVVTNATDGTSKISSLIGTGITGPTVTGTITPGTFSFGNITVGSLSTTTFTIENTGGTANLNITSATVSAAPFLKTADNCTGASLALNETCTVDVGYFPTANTSSAAVLTVVTNATNGSSKIVSVTGTGVSSGTVTGSITPASYNFPDTDVGSTNSQTFTIENTGGSGNLNISTVTVTTSTPFLSTSDTCTGTSLALNQTCTVDVVFSPTASGIFSGILTVATNASNGTNKIASFTGKTTSPGVIGFTATKYHFNNDVGTVVIYVTRAGGSSGSASVNYTTQDGTASESAGDYENSSGTLTWSNGNSTPKKIQITVAHKPYSDGTRSLFVILSPNSGSISLGISTTTVELIDPTQTVLSSDGSSGSNGDDGCRSSGSDSLWICLSGLVVFLSLKRRRFHRQIDKYVQ